MASVTVSNIFAQTLKYFSVLPSLQVFASYINVVMVSSCCCGLVMSIVKILLLCWRKSSLICCCKYLLSTIDQIRQSIIQIMIQISRLMYLKIQAKYCINLLLPVKLMLIETMKPSKLSHHHDEVQLLRSSD